jgi:hypothetical protein
MDRRLKQRNKETTKDKLIAGNTAVENLTAVLLLNKFSPVTNSEPS